MRGALVAVLLAALAVPAAAEDERLVLTAEGEVRVEPDIATVQIGVETDGDTAAEALAINAAAAEKVIAALKEAGIAAPDIQTSRFGISPIYADRKSYSSGEDGPTVQGYRVTNMVSARTGDLDGLGGVLDRVVSVGANQIRGIHFGLADDTRAMDEARRRAVAEALRRAQLYAEAAGVKLGGIVAIEEFGGHGGPVMAEARMAASAAPPIEAGSLSISVQVRVSWEIDDD